MQMPPQFEEIARLSDIARAESARAVTSHSNPELTREVIAVVKAEYESGKPRALYSALMALSDESFKELTGWVLFGRDYSPDQGEPDEVLMRYIDSPEISPREAGVIYLERKPIGKYLRNAVEHLSGPSVRDEVDDYE
jgi:DNA-binding transcriptional ArsR family regulator